MENRAELVGIALVERVEIMLDHGFDGGTVMTHWLVLLFDLSSFRGVHSANPEFAIISRFRVRASRAPE